MPYHVQGKTVHGSDRVRLINQYEALIRPDPLPEPFSKRIGSFARILLDQRFIGPSLRSSTKPKRLARPLSFPSAV
jgi:hypothetical protein